EDQFLDRIGKAYGKDVVIGYGNWSRESQMKFQPPTPGRGLRRLIHKRYGSYTIDEYGSSKYCCDCFKELKHYKKRYRCLICEDGCLSSESGRGVLKFINRDINGAKNILNCLESWLKFQRRPEGLKRVCSKGDTQSRTE